MGEKMFSYTDIHCHILPGVDDGARDLQESIAMLKLAYRENIHKVILTPHQKPDRKCVSVSGIHKRIALLSEELSRLSLNIRLYSGGELMYSHELTEQLEKGNLPTLAGSRYALVEFMPDESWSYIRDGLYHLSGSGYRPVVAHVERCAQVAVKPERVQELIDMGCRIQVNAGSLTGDWGFGLKRIAARLIKDRLVHFVATDAHRGSGRRSPQMEKCALWLKKKAGDGYARELLHENAEAIFANEEI